MLDIDRIIEDIHNLLPSNSELDDIMWNNEQTMMRTRIYRYGNEKLDRPPFANILPISKSTERRIVKYLEYNNLEYEFGQDYEKFPTIRIWESEEDNMFEGYMPPKSDFEKTGLYNANHSDATEFDIIDALSYMKGISPSKAKKNLYNGEYTKEEIQKALLYWATEGLPGSQKQEYANQLYKEFGLLDEAKKKKNVAGFFSTLYPGDPEKNAEVFNNSTSDNVSFSEISESFTEGDWMYLSEVIEGMVDNMSDDDIDSDLRLFKRIAQKLQVRNMDDVVVVVDPDGEFDPQYYVTEVGQKVGPIYKNNNDIVEYELFGVHMIAENHSGQMFLYFRDSSSAKKYMEAIEKLNESTSPAQLTESKESAQRTNLINKIKSFGKNYNFEKYTDQQLFRIANRLQDAKDIEDVMKEFAEKRKQGETVKEYDPDYDIPDETYVEKMTIREKLGQLDQQGIDNDHYLDLRNLFEAVSPTMTPEEKEELRKVVNTTNDPDIISAYLNGKYKEKDESLQENLEDSLFRRLRNSVRDFLEFCRDMEWEFPEGLIFEDWQDWMNDIEMSPSIEATESASILLDEYGHFYDVNKDLAAHGVDDWETDTFIDMYEELKDVYDKANAEWEKNHQGEE